MSTAEYLTETSTLTPEKLAIMKIRNSEDRDVFDDGDTITGSGLFSSFSAGGGGSSSVSRSKSNRALARTSRNISTSSRRSGAFMQSHRNKMSMELTSQAESKVFALIELMSNASREASSLKEYWTKLMSDRESFDREREELLLRIDEMTETVERKDTEHHGRHRELADRKKEVDRLLIELSGALNGLTEHKKKLSERDIELDGSRKELSELKIATIRLRTDYDKIKTDTSGLETRLRTSETDRDRAKEDAETFRGQVRDLTRENTDLKGRNTDITTKLDVSTKEISSYLERLRVFEREKAGDVFERERLEEAVRKATTKADEAVRELADVRERSSTAIREAKRLREALTSVEAERDEGITSLERVRLELKNKSTGLDDAEAKYGEMHLKYEQLKREIAVKEDKFSSMETEITELRRVIETKQEERRRTLLENDQLRDDLDTERRKHSDLARELVVVQDGLVKSESVLVEVRAEAFNSAERVRYIERERDEALEKSALLVREIAELKERAGALTVEIRTTADARDKARKEGLEARRRYEEVSQTITEWKDDSGELEYEIESLRTMLYEAREQKERAISARNAADRERDEYVEKYEEKCRELEKMSDSRSSFFHSSGHSHGGGKSESRTTSARYVTTRSSANGGEEVVDQE